MVTLGIDVGTSSVKVLGVDEAGGVVGFSSAPYATPRKARGVERDPEAWWAAVCMAVRDCLKQDGVAPSEVAAVGFSGHMSSVVLVDRESQVVRPALLLSVFLVSTSRFAASGPARHFAPRTSTLITHYLGQRGRAAIFGT